MPLALVTEVRKTNRSQSNTGASSLHEGLRGQLSTIRRYLAFSLVQQPCFV